MIYEDNSSTYDLEELMEIINFVNWKTEVISSDEKLD